MSFDPATLKSDVELAVHDLDEVLAIADELPLPANVKTVLDTVKSVLADVETFLNA